MLTLLATIAGFVLGGGGVWGLALKVAGWLGWSWAGAATSLPFVGILSRLAEQLIDFVFWLLRGLIYWLARGADHISKSVPAAVLTLSVAFGAWNFGPGTWRFWESAPSVSEVAELKRDVEALEKETKTVRPSRRKAVARRRQPTLAQEIDGFFRGMGL